jgi:uroporphyrinogen-III synthase
MEVLVTRPIDQAIHWVTQLAQHGIVAKPLPLLTIEALADSSAVHAAWQVLPSYQLVMFVSPNAVEQFFAQKPFHGQSIPTWPGAVQVASAGPGTTASLLEQGVPVATIIEPARDAAQLDSEALWQELRLLHWRGARVLVVAGQTGRDWLTQQLQDHGARVDRLVAYRRIPSPWTAQLDAWAQDALARPTCHLWCFSSSEAMSHLVARYPAPQWASSMALTTHPRIAQAARQAGFARVYSTGPTLAAVVACIQSAPNSKTP